VLGLGTALPAGIVGALFEILSFTVCQSCLFMAAGNVEKRTGTTDLRKIGGLAKSMPFTAVCFIIGAAAASGVPPFCGFFSRELVFGAALESNAVFYIAALLGSFLTAAAFLKMGRAAFTEKRKPPQDNKSASEAGFGILLPMGISAALCAAFGIAYLWPLNGFLKSALGYTQPLSGLPHFAALVIVSVIVLALAVCGHIYGSRKSGGAANSDDYIRFAPGLKSVYGMAEKHWLDPYDLMMHSIDGFSFICAAIEKGISWFYDDAVVFITKGAGNLLHRFNNGRLSRYLGIALAGIAGIVIIFLAVLL
jgi:NADH:ubiquinone oxidoreductase subunit 5 (subunit L)/multisubunit Na+/H+ antiporter MnhA subunit